ncbi:preprotein translocase subunit SecE [Flaviflexus massiliensis]|uniref:preprotein translocase subunit SecE n=1 Tax=Flaviflexus massiliensis TaxID=1522309 RepID=UPI0006D54B6F|nr:preprotein translocase subunit SecE [Flaviflexus massiliensis]
MSDAPTQAGDGSRSPKSEKKLGLWARIRLFFRQIIGELKKVVTPSRKELGNLFLTVTVFVIIIMVIVSLLDALFGQLAFLIFG